MCQIEHTRHRKVPNFMVNLVAGLIAYTYQPQKPSLYDIESPIYNFKLLILLQIARVLNHWA
jgi:hypothetical protein